MGSAAKNLLQEGLLWGAVALGGFALFYFFDDLKAALAPNAEAPAIAELSAPEPSAASGWSGDVRLKADPMGHFMVPAEVNGRSADFMADTGATLVVLTYEDAVRLGLSPHSLEFNGMAQTANGIARVAPVNLDRVQVEDITVRDVPAVIAEKGALATNLLGMSFLGRLKSFQMQGSELVLIK